MIFLDLLDLKLLHRDAFASFLSSGFTTMAVINPPEETGKTLWLFLITFFGLGMHAFINDYLKL